MSHPSRFDTDSLLTANGGYYFCTEVLYPLGITRYNCDIRLADSKSEPLLPNTKVVLLLGSRAMTLWLPPEIVKDNKLDNLRGSPYQLNGIVYLCSYSPQDAVDRQAWESQLNPEMLDWLEQEVSRRQETDPLSMKKRKGLTFRANYRFWLKKDVEKAIKILEKGIPEDEPTNYIIYPNSIVAVDALSSNRDAFLYFDMETDIQSGRITCFSFAYNLQSVYIVPVVLHDYSLAYSELALCQIFRALAIAISRNTLVAHNGAAFDFFMLAWKYRIPIGRRVYDTMIAAHRVFPMVEKSLGHQVSLWTYESYHKDEAQFAFGNREQAEALWRYCGKDVSSMIKVHKAITAYARTMPGLESSIDQAMQSIRPYLLTTLMGIPYVMEKVIETIAENDRLMTQYLRIIKWFIGEESYALIKKRSKKALPGSNSQCCMYFHDMLEYKVMARSKKPPKKPSLAEKPMFKLKLAYDNPVIDLILAYRKCQKETGTLKFVPWDINNTQMIENL